MVERRHRHVEYQCVESGSYWNIHWFVLVSSHEWLPELLCFPAYSRRICWAFQFRIDLSNACIYESGFLKSYPTVKQLISKKKCCRYFGWEPNTGRQSRSPRMPHPSLPDTLLSHIRIWNEESVSQSLSSKLSVGHSYCLKKLFAPLHHELPTCTVNRNIDSEQWRMKIEVGKKVPCWHYRAGETSHIRQRD